MEPLGPQQEERAVEIIQLSLEQEEKSIPSLKQLERVDPRLIALLHYSENPRLQELAQERYAPTGFIDTVKEYYRFIVGDSQEDDVAFKRCAVM